MSREGVADLGSSPRERGTPDVLSRLEQINRFIPARAGNAQRPSISWSSSPVHPRASGERDPTLRHVFGMDGSSPRERGTPRNRRRRPRTRRFIPARAGNARQTARRPISSAVHPRASGERSVQRTVGPTGHGSSPRERGTPLDERAELSCGRFIPARAGNARHRCHGHSFRPVHPRASGERISSGVMSGLASGSSPRERGTLGAFTRPRYARRFIPARAGNALSS